MCQRWKSVFKSDIDAACKVVNDRYVQLGYSCAIRLREDASSTVPVGFWKVGIR